MNNTVNYVKENSIKYLMIHGTHSWFYGKIVLKICELKSMFYRDGYISNAQFYYPICGISLRIIHSSYFCSSDLSAVSIRKLLSK